ncbi:hypothetical protein DYB30_012428, partial [Aphanomyces astaci]
LMLKVSALIARLQDQTTSDQLFLGQCLEDYSEVVHNCDDVADPFARYSTKSLRTLAKMVCVS